MSALVAAAAPVKRFAALADLAVVHGFVGRVTGLDVNTERAEALARLAAPQREARASLGLDARRFVTAEQVHGSEVAVLTWDDAAARAFHPGADGLITNRDDVCLGIYVADCCAVYIVDPVHQAIGLVHAGKKGTELGVVPAAIRQMQAHFGTVPVDLTVQLSPCVRPPWYEVDFASEIVAQCRAIGTTRISDEGICTAAYLDQYYSYRREKGRTGRMLALLALR